tara:strand:- start:2109 stop:2270 length:162 start_codon:yes stop_codon:yes gene_type:complete
MPSGDLCKTATKLVGAVPESKKFHLGAALVEPCVPCHKKLEKATVGGGGGGDR